MLAKVEDEGDGDHCFDKQGVIHKEVLESELFVQELGRLLKETSKTEAMIL